MSDDKFSVGLRLNDLDDFITPSQTCVAPTGQAAAPKKPSAAEKRAKIELTDEGYMEVDASGNKSALQAAEISLADCLACSGCITSAESVLVTAQSAERLRELLAAHPDRVAAPLIFTISPQSLAALSVHMKKPLFDTFSQIASFLHTKLGAAAVMDASVFSALSAVLVADEFLAEPSKRPLLASECPGWVCYAEKAQPEALPHIAVARSAQALAGSFVRALWGATALHVAVMPCYDKKLEAARSDFANAETGERDVDLVLATQELLDVAGQENVDLALVSPEDPAVLLETALGAVGVAAPQKLARVLAGRRAEGSDELCGPHWAGTATSAAGGSLEYVLRRAVRSCYGVEMDDPRVEVRQFRGRNADMREYAVSVAGEQKTLRFASAYGFRNIQNVVRKLKTHSCSYDYVEIMACPHACVNGGGQPRAAAGESSRLPDTKTAYDSRTHVDADVWAEELRSALPAGLTIAHNTEYHSRKSDKPTNALQIKW